MRAKLIIFFMLFGLLPGVVAVDSFTNGVIISGNTGSPEYTALQIHSTSESYWNTLMYNDVYGSSSEVYGYFIWNNGTFAQGSEQNLDTWFYFNSNWGNPALVIATDWSVHGGKDNRGSLGKSTVRWADLYLAGILSDGTDTVNVDQLNASVIHTTSDGSDHTFIDQDVTTTADTVFNNVTVSTNISANNIHANIFYGNGSGLTGLPSGFTYGDHFDQGLNTTSNVVHNNLSISQNLSVGSLEIYENTTHVLMKTDGKGWCIGNC